MRYSPVDYEATVRTRKQGPRNQFSENQVSCAELTRRLQAYKGAVKKFAVLARMGDNTVWTVKRGAQKTIYEPTLRRALYVLDKLEGNVDVDEMELVSELEDALDREDTTVERSLAENAKMSVGLIRSCAEHVLDGAVEETLLAATVYVSVLLEIPVETVARKLRVSMSRLYALEGEGRRRILEADVRRIANAARHAVSRRQAAEAVPGAVD